MSHPVLASHVAPVSVRDAGLAQQIADFRSPLTRVLLASDGLTTTALEAVLGATLRLQVLRQHQVPPARLPVAVTALLGAELGEQSIFRASALVGPDQATVSLNQVILATRAVADHGLADRHRPIGYNLRGRNVSHSRSVIAAGQMMWRTGGRVRVCAFKSYVIYADRRPLCFIRERFNPDLIPAQ